MNIVIAWDMIYIVSFLTPVNEQNNCVIFFPLHVVFFIIFVYLKTCGRHTETPFTFWSNMEDVSMPGHQIIS